MHRAGLLAPLGADRERARDRTEHAPQQRVAEDLAGVRVDVAGQQRGDEHEQREHQAPGRRPGEPRPERQRVQPRALVAREHERGGDGHEREDERRHPVGLAEDVEERVVLEAGQHELAHLAERLLEVGRVVAQEADQRAVGQRREHQGHREADAERPGADDPRRRPPAGCAGARRARRRAPPRAAAPAKAPPGAAAPRLPPTPVAEPPPRALPPAAPPPRVPPPASPRAAVPPPPVPARGFLRNRLCDARVPQKRAAAAVGASGVGGAAWRRAARHSAQRGAPQFGQNRARSESLWPHWSQNAIAIAPAWNVIRQSGATVALALLAQLEGPRHIVGVDRLALRARALEHARQALEAGL